MTQTMKIPVGVALADFIADGPTDPPSSTAPTDDPASPIRIAKESVSQPYVPAVALQASETALAAINGILVRAGFKMVGQRADTSDGEGESSFVFVDPRYNRVMITTRRAFYRSPTDANTSPNPELIANIRAETVLGMCILSEYFDRPVVYPNDVKKLAVLPVIAPNNSQAIRDEIRAMPFVARINVAVRMLEMINWSALGDTLDMALRGNETARFWAEEADGGEFVVRENPLAWREVAGDGSAWTWHTYAGQQNTVLKNASLSHRVESGSRLGLRPVAGNKLRVLVPELGDTKTFTMAEATARQFMSRLERKPERPAQKRDSPTINLKPAKLPVAVATVMPDGSRHVRVLSTNASRE